MIYTHECPLDPSEVSAVLVTRGNVDLAPIIEALPYDEVIVWDNSKRLYNLGVMGRFAAIAETTRPYVYTQDDDCIILDHHDLLATVGPRNVTGIMPTDLLPEHCLLGYGSMFPRHLPGECFARWLAAGGSIRDMVAGHCDMIFGTLAEKVRLEYGPEQPWHSTKHQTPDEARAAGISPIKMMPYHFGDVDPNRMHMQGSHDERRHRIYAQCLQILAGETRQDLVTVYGDEDQR